MTEQSPATPTDDNHHYNHPDDCSHTATPGTGKIDVITPSHLQEFDTGAARAILHLIIEVHRKRTTKSRQSTEDT